MITTTALPPKAEKVTCTKCHLVASRSMIPPTHSFKGELRGRCANRKACEVRQLRARNKAKANAAKETRP